LIKEVNSADWFTHNKLPYLLDSHLCVQSVVLLGIGTQLYMYILNKIMQTVSGINCEALWAQLKVYTGQVIRQEILHWIHITKSQ
jgi:hypothetical protein